MHDQNFRIKQTNHTHTSKHHVHVHTPCLCGCVYVAIFSKNWIPKHYHTPKMGTNTWKLLFFDCQTKLNTRIALWGIRMPFFVYLIEKQKWNSRKKIGKRYSEKYVQKKTKELNHMNYFNRFYYPIEFECTFYAWSVYVIIIHCFFVWKEENRGEREREWEWMCVYTQKSSILPVDIIWACACSVVYVT